MHSVPSGPDSDDDQATPGEDLVEPLAEPLVEEELLIEEISIDGMCGVY